MIPAAVAALIIWFAVSPTAGIVLGRMIAAADRRPTPPPPESDAEWLPAWLIDPPTMPLSADERARFDRLVGGAA